MALLATLATMLLFSSARAALTDDECLTCHSDRTLARSDGHGFAFADTAALHASPHARLACRACHASVTSIPHELKLPAVRCQSCHAAIGDTLSRSVHRGVVASGGGCAGCHDGHTVKRASRMGLESCRGCHEKVSGEYQGSVHGMALARGDNEASTCRDCHGGIHAIRSHLDSTSATSRARLAETCGHCHADRALMTRRRITIPEAYQLFRASVHGRSKNPKAATCTDCHESHRLLRVTDPASSIHRTHIASTCGRCHSREARDYEGSVHGTALARGVTASPVCIDCHGEHRVSGPREPGSPVAAAGVSKTCSRCHEAEGIRETFGLPSGRLATWQDSYHGLAARGGSPAVANCASCHGYHSILPSSDPRSDIAPANLPRTCGKCHPGAGAKFSIGAVHVAMARPEHPVMLWVRRLYLWLIALTIGGMLVHNALDFAAKFRAHARRQLGRASAAAGHAGEVVTQLIERMTLSERIQHALLLSSFFTLVYTGFALKFPEALPFAWFARLEGGYAWRSLIHRGAAIVMVAAAMIHVVYLFTRRGRGMLGDMLPRPKDATDAVSNVLYLTGLRRTPPAFDRFGYIEKAEYWALVWGTMVMTATGLALWFENISLRWLQKWMLDLATLVHYYEAWLAFLAIVVWHLYYVIVNPEAYPMNLTWITGRISSEALRHEHPLEWERLEASAEQGEEVERDEPEDRKPPDKHKEETNTRADSPEDGG